MNHPNLKKAIILFGGEAKDWRVHRNGGGLVQKTATVADTAHVGEKAIVAGYAKVLDNAEVLDNARVCDDAKVYDDAEVFGNADVYGYAWVYGEARVYGEALIYGNARVYDDARVYGDARVSGILSKRSIIVSGSRDAAILLDDNEIQIGCEKHTISYWLLNYQEIGRRHGYSDGEIQEYRIIIQMLTEQNRVRTK